MKQFSLLSLLLLGILLLTAQQCEEKHTLPQTLYGSWIHSHEEDYGENMVYRTTAYPFPPSRGRERFDIRQDGTLLYYGIAPTDGMADPIEGQWEAIMERTIEVSIPQQQESAFTAELVEVANDRLVIRKVDNY